MIFANHVDVVVAPLLVVPSWPVVGVDHFHVPHFTPALYPLEDGLGVVGVASPSAVTFAVSRTEPAAQVRVERDHKIGVRFVLLWCAIVFEFHRALLFVFPRGGGTAAPRRHSVAGRPPRLNPALHRLGS